MGFWPNPSGVHHHSPSSSWNHPQNVVPNSLLHCVIYKIYTRMKRITRIPDQKKKMLAPHWKKKQQHRARITQNEMKCLLWLPCNWGRLTLSPSSLASNLKSCTQRSYILIDIKSIRLFPSSFLIQLFPYRSVEKKLKKEKQRRERNMSIIWVCLLCCVLGNGNGIQENSKLAISILQKT